VILPGFLSGSESNMRYWAKAPAVRRLYQFTPNDTHDWDSTEDMVLVDRMWHGENRKLLLHADRNGVFYVIDRATGKFLAASPLVRASGVKGWDENGRPITTENWRANPEGTTVYPSLGGGSNFQAPSYSPLTSWMYFAYLFMMGRGVIQSARLRLRRASSFRVGGTGVASDLRPPTGRQLPPRA
jgi:hypothetical protein